MNAVRIVIVSAALAAALSGCSSRTVVRTGDNKGTDPVVVTQDSKKKGPPAHAPAHGYRYQHAEDGVVLTYDSKIGVYVVTGYNHTYFNNSVYFRYASDRWELSKRVKGPWKAVVERDVPPGLKERYADYIDKTASLKSKESN